MQTFAPSQEVGLRFHHHEVCKTYLVLRPIIVQAQDADKNGISGVAVNFTANNGAVPTRLPW